jgi:23S rRNA pseudouridine1911/1915/1917 synthase
MGTADDKPVREVKLVIPPLDSATRLDRYLAEQPQLELTRNRIQKLMSESQVLVDGRPVGKNFQVKGGEAVTVSVTPKPELSAAAEPLAIDIVYSDEHLAVVNKPAGMVTHPAPGNPTGTLVNALLHGLGSLALSAGPERPGIVHRLDKNTSGLIIVARTEKALTKLQQMVSQREVKRIYHAIVCGHLDAMDGEVDLPIGRSLKDRKKMAVTNLHSRPAKTLFHVIERYRSYDRLEIELLTGRTHQIRVHFAHLGHPVFGDPEYGGREKWHRGLFAPERLLSTRLLKIIPRQALLAKKLAFDHPITGCRIELEVDLPTDFANLVSLLQNEGV